jgi:hypothetical protein
VAVLAAMWSIWLRPIFPVAPSPHHGTQTRRRTSRSICKHAQAQTYQQAKCSSEAHRYATDCKHDTTGVHESSSFLQMPMWQPKLLVRLSKRHGHFKMTRTRRPMPRAESWTRRCPKRLQRRLVTHFAFAFGAYASISASLSCH